MAASLANTKWKFKDSPDLSSFSAAGTTYSINFTSNSTTYTSLKLTNTSINYDTTVVYVGQEQLEAPTIELGVANE